MSDLFSLPVHDIVKKIKDGKLTSVEICKSYIEDLSADKKSKLDVTKLIGELIVNKKLKVKGIPYSGEWGEVDSIKDLDIYNK